MQPSQRHLLGQRPQPFGANVHIHRVEHRLPSPDGGLAVSLKHIWGLPVDVQIPMGWPHLEAAIVMLKVPMAEPTGGFAGADVFPGIEKVARVGEPVLFEGLEDE